MEGNLPKVVYVCDRMACDGCKDNGFCNHTSNIEHAANFELDNGVYVERETKGTRKIVVVKVRSMLHGDDATKIYNRIIEQARNGIIIADATTDIYNIDVEEDISTTEVMVKFVR